MRVKVYYNLHNHKWSIKDTKTGLVVGHADSIVLSDVIPSVSQAGRQRVLREKKKNVHAYLVGEAKMVTNFNAYKGRKFTIKEDDVSTFPFMVHEITYNPYKHNRFVMKANELGLLSADFVELNFNKTVFASGVLVDETN